MRSKMPVNTKGKMSLNAGAGRSHFGGVCVFIDNRFVPRVAGERGGLQGWGWRPVVRPDWRPAGQRPHMMPLMLTWQV